ncbi:hypothetical protein BJ742DRAFT_418306 [Cladochytrium replicatum]|nr:hypothetical protein BJ742DRAFT_418306 [Cladochytrium replicatum]
MDVASEKSRPAQEANHFAAGRYVVEMQPSPWRQFKFLFLLNMRLQFVRGWARSLTTYVIAPLLILLAVKLLAVKPGSLSVSSVELDLPYLADMCNSTKITNISGPCLVHLGLWWNPKTVSPEDAAVISNFPQAIITQEPGIVTQNYNDSDSMLAASRGTLQDPNGPSGVPGFHQLGIGIAIHEFSNQSMRLNYTLFGRHSLLVKYGYVVQSHFDTYIVNQFRSVGSAQNDPLFTPSIRASLKQFPMPMIQLNLVNYYALVIAVTTLPLSLVLLVGITSRIIQDRTSMFRSILERANLYVTMDLLALIASIIPGLLAMSFVVVAFFYASGEFHSGGVHFLSSWLVIFVGFLANVLLSCAWSIRLQTTALSKVFSGLLVFLSAFSVKSYYVGGVGNSIEFFNVICPPATLSLAISGLVKSEMALVGGTVASNPDIWKIDLITNCLWRLVVQAAVLLLVTLYLDLVLPGSTYTARRPPWFLFQPKFWATPKRQVTSLQKPSASAADTAQKPAVLEVRLDKNLYGETPFGIRDVHVDLPAGQAIALLGHNGAGKSTFISLITGGRKVAAGSLRYLGAPLDSAIASADQYDECDITQDVYSFAKFQQSLGICPQHDALREDLSVYEHLELIAAVRGITKVYRRDNTSDETQLVEVPIKDYFDDLLDVLELSHKKHNPVGSYSGGMKRKSNLAIALCGEPRVLVLDEFTVGMDIVARLKIWKLIERLTKSSQRVVIFSTHDMEEASVLGDSVVVIADGALLETGTPQQLKDTYSTGTRLHIHKLPHFDREDLEAELAKYFGECEFRSDSGATISYVVPKQKDAGTVPPEHDDQKAVTKPTGDRIAAGLRKLNASRTRLGIADIDVSTETLEEVFMRLTEIYHEKLRQQGGNAVHIALASGFEAVRRRKGYEINRPSEAELMEMLAAESKNLPKVIKKMQTNAIWRFRRRQTFLSGCSTVTGGCYCAVCLLGGKLHGEQCYCWNCRECRICGIAWLCSNYTGKIYPIRSLLTVGWANIDERSLGRISHYSQRRWTQPERY